MDARCKEGTHGIETTQSWNRVDQHLRLDGRFAGLRRIKELRIRARIGHARNRALHRIENGLAEFIGAMLEDLCQVKLQRSEPSVIGWECLTIGAKRSASITTRLPISNSTRSTARLKQRKFSSAPSRAAASGTTYARCQPSRCAMP